MVWFVGHYLPCNFAWVDHAIDHKDKVNGQQFLAVATKTVLFVPFVQVREDLTNKTSEKSMQNKIRTTYQIASRDGRTLCEQVRNRADGTHTVQHIHCVIQISFPTLER